LHDSRRNNGQTTLSQKKKKDPNQKRPKAQTPTPTPTSRPVVPSPLLFNLAIVAPPHTPLQPPACLSSNLRKMRKWVVNLLSAVVILVLLLGLGYGVAWISTIPNPVQNLIPSLGLSSLELGGGGRGAGAPAKVDGGAAAPPPPAARRSGPQDGKGGGGGSTPSAPSGSGGGARTPSAPSGSGPPGMDSAPPPPPNTQKVIFFSCLAGDHPVPVPPLPPAVTRPWRCVLLLGSAPPPPNTQKVVFFPASPVREIG
jgi:hypothetical protein